MDNDNLELLAQEAADELLERVSGSSPEHIARMAWLDGYAAGHSAATDHAIHVIRDSSPFSEPVKLAPGELDPRD